VEYAVTCLQLFIKYAKLRSATFKISSENANFEIPKLWRQKLLHNLKIKEWSKVTRVRCELSLFVSFDTIFNELLHRNE